MIDAVPMAANVGLERLAELTKVVQESCEACSIGCAESRSKRRRQLAHIFKVMLQLFPIFLIGPFRGVGIELDNGRLPWRLQSGGEGRLHALGGLAEAPESRADMHQSKGINAAATVPGMVVRMERRFIKERQREGIERAKSEGIYQGGKQIGRAHV